MKPMIGEIGKFVLDGKQVGGFRNWTVFVQTVPPIKSWVVASGFWLLEQLPTDRVIACFYAEGQKELFLIRSEEAIIKLPDKYDLDILIIEPIEMTFEKDFDWRKA